MIDEKELQEIEMRAKCSPRDGVNVVRVLEVDIPRLIAAIRELRQENNIVSTCCEAAIMIGTAVCGKCETLCTTRYARQSNKTAARQSSREVLVSRADIVASIEAYAETIASQNDLSKPVENWSDFHCGQNYAALELAESFRALSAKGVHGK